MKFQNMELTKEQFRSLLKMLFLGQWVATEHRFMNTEEFEIIEQYVYSYAKQFGSTDWVVYDEETNKYYPTQEMENELMPLVDEYNDFNFWDELMYRLAERDLFRDLGEEQVKTMTQLERYEKMQPYIDIYNAEFEENGLEKISFKK